MSKETRVIFLGFLVAIMPLLGFPESWRMIFLIILGAGLIIIGFVMRSQNSLRKTQAGESGFAQTFAQSDMPEHLYGSEHEE